MRLTQIRPGDIVKVDDGLPYLATVRERHPRELTVQQMVGCHAVRRAKAREIQGHWRKVA